CGGRARGRRPHPRAGPGHRHGRAVWDCIGVAGVAPPAGAEPHPREPVGLRPRARHVPPVRDVQRGRPGSRGAGGHHQRRRRGRPPPRGVSPRGRNAGRAPPREAARRQGGGVRGPRLRPHGAVVRHAPATGVPALRVPARLQRRRGGRGRRGGRQDRAVHGPIRRGAARARVGGVDADAGQHVRRVAGRGPTQADGANGVPRGE
ncbi:hypothetical protein ACJX0J_017655, partial [Zea mays]